MCELTESAAMAELTARPLTFGDDAQIRAHRFLIRVENAWDAYTEKHGYSLQPFQDELGSYCPAVLHRYNDDVIAAVEARLQLARQSRKVAIAAKWAGRATAEQERILQQ